MSSIQEKVGVDVNALSRSDRDRHLRTNEAALAQLHNQTKSSCWASLEAFGHTLKHVREQTAPLCLVAVSRDGDALQYVDVQEWEVVHTAIEKSPLALRFVRDKTAGISLLAVRRDGWALQYVNRDAVSADDYAAIVLAAVENAGTALQFAKYQDQEIVDAAILNNKLARRYARPEFLKGKNLS